MPYPQILNKRRCPAGGRMLKTGQFPQLRRVPTEKRMRKTLIACLAGLLCSAAGAQSLTRAEVDAMVAQCEQMRQEKLAPVREEKIQQCIESGEREPDRCRRYYATYGEVRHVGGVPRPGMFSDLPECQNAYNAQREFNRSSSR